jgi:DNA-binding transcriptional LysR family regulator
MMNLDDLHVFLTVAQASGINRAAPYLDRVASNVSTRIAHLERLFGTPLFVRSNSGMSLTREGEILRTHAYRLLRSFEDTRAALGSKDQPAMLRIGFVPSIRTSRVVDILSVISERQPRCDLQLMQGTTRELCAKVWEGEIDGAFCDDEEDIAGIRYVKVDREVLVLAGGRHWTGKPQRRAISVGTDCVLRRRLDAWYLRQNAVPGEYVVAPGFESLLLYVIAGSALAVVPASVLSSHDFTHLLAIRPLPAPLDNMQTSFAYHESRTPHAFISAIQHVLDGTSTAVRASDEKLSSAKEINII